MGVAVDGRRGSGVSISSVVNVEVAEDEESVRPGEVSLPRRKVPVSLAQDVPVESVVERKDEPEGFLDLLPYPVYSSRPP